ncbi:MAG TPA: hypothetical protein VF845_13495 [Terriglobales bacterium]
MSRRTIERIVAFAFKVVASMPIVFPLQQTLFRQQLQHLTEHRLMRFHLP